MSLPKNSLVLLSTVILACTASAQVRGIPPSLLTGPAQDPGVPVEMFESASLDLFLRRAQNFLAEEDYGKAIKVLQDVIEGRTAEFLDPEAEKKKKAKAKADAKKKKNNPFNQAKVPTFELPIDDDDPAYSVFSSDEKVFRPVARLCHELLASMPSEGVGLYRVKYEVLAEKLYREAIATSDLSKLETVYNNYFVTLNSARAMRDASNLLMDAGRFRAAIQTINTLLEVYPDISRREAGIRDLVLMVKMAICFQQLGDFDLAKEQLAATTRTFPEDSIRLMGELHTVKLLHESELFDASNVVVAEKMGSTFTLDLAKSDRLVPLWEFRYKAPKPYHSKSSTPRNAYRSNPRGRVVSGNQFPTLKRHVPGTSVQFLENSLVFVDSYRPVVHELTSGRQSLAMGSPQLAELPRVHTSAIPQARTPVYDYFQNRVAMDAQRYYSIIGYNKSVSGQQTFRAICENRLVAYDRKTGAEVWFLDSKADRKRPITFLAAPTVYRKLLLVPFLDAGSYGLMALRSADGKETYRTYLHYRGTAFARAPAAPVVVDSGIAYVLTNAGVVAAVDANTGVLSWSRKYERVHPKRGTRRPKTSSRRRVMFGRGIVQPMSARFRGFGPTELYIIDDLIIVAAVDSTVLLCLNGASGAAMWLHNAESPKKHEVLDNQLSYVVGHNEKYLFVMCGESQLLCVGIRNGVRYWAAHVPGSDAGGESAGRGFVTDDYVVLPGKPDSRLAYVIDANSQKLPSFRTIELPAFSIGKEPLGGPTNLFINGAYLALCYEGGVELYSSAGALAKLARESATPNERATYLIHAGELENAAAILFVELDRTDLDAAARNRLSIRVLSLVEEISSGYAKQKRREQALAILDQSEKRVRGSRHIRRVHLFRLQVFRELRDLAGIEREQEFIETGEIK